MLILAGETKKIPASISIDRDFSSLYYRFQIPITFVITLDLSQ